MQWLETQKLAAPPFRKPTRRILLDQPLVFWFPLDVALDKGTDRLDCQLLLPGVVEPTPDQRPRNPSSFQSRRYRGRSEQNLSAGTLVGQLSTVPLLKYFKAAFSFVVKYVDGVAHFFPFLRCEGGEKLSAAAEGNRCPLLRSGRYTECNSTLCSSVDGWRSPQVEPLTVPGSCSTTGGRSSKNSRGPGQGWPSGCCSRCPRRPRR